jgi:hypothetical protein
MILFPYKKKYMNILSCLNEIILVIIIVCFFKFVDLEVEPDDIDMTGWIIIGLCIALVVLNFIVELLDKLIMLFIWIKGLIYAKPV